MTEDHRNDHSAEAVEALTAVVGQHYGGDWSAALAAVAGQGDMAVAVLDRQCFADYFTDVLGTDMTDEQWSRIKGDIGDFDDYLARQDTTTEYIEHVLTREEAYDDSFDDE